MTANLFDANFYRSSYSDLAKLTDSQALAHYQTFGIKEGRLGSAFLDLKFYRASNSDLAGLSDQDLFNHAQNFGVKEGRKLSPFVDLDFYLNSNFDLKQAFGSNREQALAHLQTYGLQENRRFSQFVNLDYYLGVNNDVNKAVNGDRAKALQHLETFGIKENRQFSELFDATLYLANNADVNQAFKGDRLLALEHLETYGLDEGRKFSVPLDLNYYKNNNSDLQAAKFSNRQLVDHYEIYGIKEGRSSSAFFNANYYLANNSDLKAAGYNQQQALQHFAAYGLAEARNANTKNNVAFTGVASGDPSTNSAILWTRTSSAVTKQGMMADLLVQVSTDPQFKTIQHSLVTQSNPNRDYTVKLDDTVLASNTRYYYRFLASGGELSQTGTFKTAANPTDKVAVKIGFIPDADGRFRPYPVTQNFDQLNLDALIFLGDTIYETAATNSPAAADPYLNPTQALADYRRKYREGFEPTTPGGFSSLQTMYASQANFTLLDNHELGNKQFQAGGAPTGTPSGSGVDAKNTVNDANITGSFMNQTTGFKTLEQAYSDYQPIREKTISAPNDPRTNGTQQLYNFQQFGANEILINVDDRSYRDIRLSTLDSKGASIDDTGSRADNPNRTMLGSTQLAWLKQTLLDAKNNGVTWKVISVSSPIDEVGNDGGKSWIGGYRSERNDLMQFIANNKIENVVFISADDHQNRINELTYFDSNNQKVVLPKAFIIVDGPVGAGGPDAITDHSFSNIKSLTDTLVNTEKNAGINPIGLDPKFPGLQNVFRELDPNADTTRQAVDFYSPDTFNYVTLDVSADGKTLSVNSYGINSYQANTFPSPSNTGAPRRLLGFQVVAA